MSFYKEYKRLDDLCRVEFNWDAGISAYIDKMKELPNGDRFVPDWKKDYKLLVHYKKIATQIIEENAWEEAVCKEGDEDWIKGFAKRIEDQNDPLSLLVVKYRELREQTRVLELKKIEEESQKAAIKEEKPKRKAKEAESEEVIRHYRDEDDELNKNPIEGVLDVVLIIMTLILIGVLGYIFYASYVAKGLMF